MGQASGPPDHPHAAIPISSDNRALARVIRAGLSDARLQRGAEDHGIDKRLLCSAETAQVHETLH